MTLQSPLTDIKGVGPELAKKFATLGVQTVAELLDYYPRRYDDYSNLQTISQLKPGIVSIQARISQVKGRYVRRGLHITEAIASDDSGSVRLVWFNQPYRAASLKTNSTNIDDRTHVYYEYYISGQFELSNRRWAIMNPSMELVSDFPVNTARILPVYGLTKGLRQADIRKALRAIAPAIEELEETLPSWVLEENKLISLNKATLGIHFPESEALLSAAKLRLGFEEVFRLSLASLLNKYELLKEHSLKIPFKVGLAKQFVTELPFKLTDAQRRVVWQIYQDLDKEQPMNRLLEGDVGSGKTVVATMAALMAMEQGFQVAFMAPTELLARQHAETIYKLLKPLGFAEQVGLLIGSLKPNQKSLVQKKIKTGEIRLMIGTHALISEKVNVDKLGLVVIDEQHRFGVEQRKKLLAKAGHAPHVLNLTATPIPRSLALTLYGELDISVIATKPADRRQIITKIISPNSRAQLNKKIEEQLEAGRQVFVVCPLISESDVSAGQSVEKVFDQIKKDFKASKVGLLHGKLKADLKAKTMEDFVGHKLDILVSTTVIEVGVDVPNATVMIIEDADKFGLAQIHQLRGRVGRSLHQGYCYLITSDSSSPSRRLRALEQIDDGFKLAELDLELRGPGAIYGLAQHGVLDLRIAKLTDTKLISSARQAAQEFIDKGENLLEYKQLYAHVSKLRAITNLN
ncbi:MAG: ATP-dependent DNA helicase RecG [Candidatus Saccharimonadales bacterium]